MSDLELCKLRTASPASGTVELIRRCHWAHDRIEALEATSFRLTEERDRAISWRDHDKERAERAEARIKAADALEKACDALRADRDALRQALLYMVNHAGQLERDEGIFWEATEIARAALEGVNPAPPPQGD